MSDWVVMKFGGTSVTGSKNWKNILSIIQGRLQQGERLFIVCSAISNISDQLERLASAVRSGRSYDDALNKLIRIHKAQAIDMGLDPNVVVGDIFDDLRKLLRGASLIQEVSPRLWARILSAGELMSTKLGAAWLWSLEQ